MAFVPFVPDLSDWELFNDQLIHYFDEQQVPNVNEDNWRIVADFFAGNGTFAAFGVSNGDGFIDWTDWAGQFITAVNGGDDA